MELGSDGCRAEQSGEREARRRLAETSEGRECAGVLGKMQVIRPQFRRV